MLVTITHQLFSDLLGNLSHNRLYSVLNNHTGGKPINGTNQFLIYEDNGEGDIFAPNADYLVTHSGRGVCAILWARTRRGCGC